MQNKKILNVISDYLLNYKKNWEEVGELKRAIDEMQTKFLPKMDTSKAPNLINLIETNKEILDLRIKTYKKIESLIKQASV